MGFHLLVSQMLTYVNFDETSFLRHIYQSNLNSVDKLNNPIETHNFKLIIQLYCMNGTKF